MKSALRLLPFLLLFCLTAASAEENFTEYFLQGRKLLGEQNYAAALEAFQKADALKADLPEVQYGLGACLNALGKYPEAKTKAEAAFRLLQNRPRRVGVNWGPIDIGYYALLSDIQANLNEFEGAVETIGKYTVPAPKEGSQAQSMETLNTAKKNLAAKFAANGIKCLGAGDLDCLRRALAQAEKLQAPTPEVLLAVSKAAVSQAERMAAASDEDKAKKIELCRLAIDVARRLPQAEADKPEAKRVLAHALSGTKDSQDYQEAVKILTSLWTASAEQKPSDYSILLDLTAVYLNGEEWDPAARSASKYISLAPEDSRGQAFCRRSFAYYKLGQFQDALDDGAKCTNADGTHRQLKHLENCRIEIQRQKAAEATILAQKASLESECKQLNREVEWARTVQDPDLEVLVPIMVRLESSKAKCKAFLENPDTSQLCRTGIFTASNPANLSTAKPEDLKQLDALTSKFLKLCETFLNQQQKANIQDALRRISG